MKKIWIMSGPSGGGKTTYRREKWPDAIELTDESQVAAQDRPVVVSTDFMLNAPGVVFDESKKNDGHGWCWRMFWAAVQHGCETIIVDNTNTLGLEVGAYYLPARSQGYEVEVVTCMPDSPKIAHARNTHKVPLAVVERHFQRLRKRDLPPWVMQTFIPT